MVSESLGKLTQFVPAKEFFMGVDSDGCVFDSMEIKHKECFCPTFIRHFGLQPISQFAKETWEFVNLYSLSRGCHRFVALVKALDLLAERKEVKESGVIIPRLQVFRDWMVKQSKLGNPALEAAILATGHPELTMVWEWSLAVNDAVHGLVHGVPVFSWVKPCLQKTSAQADLVVVSQTPTDVIEREWSEHQIDGYPRAIAGQEWGTKTEQLTQATWGKYRSSKVLMVGDAPGDLEAAKAVKALFFPIIPGAEAESWQALYEEGLGRFFSERFAGKYQAELIQRFEETLPALPPWKR